jgi:hypothetical protein
MKIRSVDESAGTPGNSRGANAAEEKRREAARLFSAGFVDGMTAVRRGGFPGYRSLLDALGEYGFSYPVPPDDELKPMVENFVGILKAHRAENERNEACVDHEFPLEP